MTQIQYPQSNKCFKKGNFQAEKKYAKISKGFTIAMVVYTIIWGIIYILGALAGAAAGILSKFMYNYYVCNMHAHIQFADCLYMHKGPMN